MARYELTDRDAERFWSKVTRTRGCWRWGGSFFTQTGYAIFNMRMTDGVWRPTVAHRVAYELAVGPIPNGLTIDHLCRNRACVNPAHMEAVTIGINVLRSDGPSARQARWTHCPRGHPFDEQNTYRRSSGKRECRACMRERDRNRPRTEYICVICGASYLAEPRKAGRTCSRPCTMRLAWQSRR